MVSCKKQLGDSRVDSWTHARTFILTPFAMITTNYYVSYDNLSVCSCVYMSTTYEAYRGGTV